jgi:hypothetical protein
MSMQMAEQSPGLEVLGASNMAAPIPGIPMHASKHMLGCRRVQFVPTRLL